MFKFFGARPPLFLSLLALTLFFGFSLIVSPAFASDTNPGANMANGPELVAVFGMAQPALHKTISQNAKREFVYNLSITAKIDDQSVLQELASIGKRYQTNKSSLMYMLSRLRYNGLSYGSGLKFGIIVRYISRAEKGRHTRPRFRRSHSGTIYQLTRAVSKKNPLKNMFQRVYNSQPQRKAIRRLWRIKSSS